MTGLEHSLRELAAELDYPPTPALADALGERLRAEPTRRPLRTRRGLAIAAAAVLLPTAAAAAVPPVREAVLELVGIEGVEVERAPELRPRPTNGRLDLGRRVSRAEAARLADYALVAPRELGPPDAIYFRGFPPGGAVSLVYRARPGRRLLLLTQFRGAVAPVYVRKVVGPGTSIARVQVNGEPGVWLSGRPHEFRYLDARGLVRRESLRLAGNTLLWERGPLTLRLEGARSRADALRIARATR